MRPCTHFRLCHATVANITSLYTSSSTTIGGGRFDFHAQSNHHVGGQHKSHLQLGCQTKEGDETRELDLR